jgi:hypothetical protein
MLVTALKAGDWRVNGDTIKFDEDGLLIDGQHRLQAIITSGLPVQTYVIRGLPRGSFDTLDIGKPRTPADTLSSLGYSQTIALAAAMRQMLILDYLSVSGFYTWQTHGPAYDATLLTPARARSMITQHLELPEWVLLARRMRAAGVPSGDGFWAGTLYWFSCSLPDAGDDVTAFAEGLISGAALEVNNPILVLRNRLFSIKEASRLHRVTGEQIMALVIKGWNAFRRGETITILKWSRGGASKEKFPIPI